jgi:hypothetical protein
MATALHREPWNKGIIVGQKAPLKLKEVWAIRVKASACVQTTGYLQAGPQLRTSLHVNTRGSFIVGSWSSASMPQRMERTPSEERRHRSCIDERRISEPSSCC